MHLNEGPARDPDQELGLLDLTCPSCGADLIADELFLSHRMCGTCNRHFSIGARERVSLLVDGGQLEEIQADLTPVEPSPNRDSQPAERQADRQSSNVIEDAVVTGTGRIGGVPAVIIALDDHLVGSALGALLTDKIIHALEHARTRRFPVVFIGAGSGTAQVGPLTLVQGNRLASEFARMHLEGLATICVLVHPVSAAVYGALAVHCDLVFAEPGVQILPGHPLPPGPLAIQTAADLAASGWIDGVVARNALRERLGKVLDVLRNTGSPRVAVPQPATDASPLSAGECLANLDRPDRPSGRSLVERLIPDLIELRGDRVAGDDPAITCGVGRIESISVAIVAQGPGEDRDSPIAARKIARISRFAGRLELPLIMLVDGGKTQEPRSFDPARAQAAGALSTLLAMLPVPLISIAVGRVSGTLAPVMMTADRTFLLSNSVFLGDYGGRTYGPPVRLPRGPGRAPGESVVLTAREGERLGIVDRVVAETAQAGRPDPEAIIGTVHQTLVAALAELAGTGPRRLVDTRHCRQRTLGQSTPEGLAAARSELWELHEWQRSVGKSIDEWRDRWEQLKASQPRLAFQRPDMSELAARLRARRAELLERARSSDRG
jgi:acyl-CoA carboxylase subunit beta